MTGEIQNPSRAGYFSKTAEKIGEHIAEREMKEGDSARMFYIFQLDLLMSDLEKVKDGILSRMTPMNRKSFEPEQTAQ